MYWNDLTDLEFVQGFWPQVGQLDPDVLESLFLSANELCRAYAPIGVPAPIPERYLLAEIFQARDIWAQIGPGNRPEVGPDGFQIPITRLNYLARDLLRPKTSPLKRLR